MPALPACTVLVGSVHDHWVARHVQGTRASDVDDAAVAGSRGSAVAGRRAQPWPGDPPSPGPSFPCSVEASALAFSPDGAVLALTTAAGVELYDAGSCALLRRLDCPGLLAASFSPSGAWLVGQARPAKGAEPEPNLRVWRVADGEVCLALHQKLFSRETWPAVKFGPGDAWAYHQVTNTIHAFDTDNWGAGEGGFLGEFLRGWGVGEGGEQWRRGTSATAGRAVCQARASENRCRAVVMGCDTPPSCRRAPPRAHSGRDSV